MTAPSAPRASSRPAVPATDWLCAGSACWHGNAPGCTLASTLLDRFARATARVGVQRWVRYRVDLERIAPSTEGVKLTALTDDLVSELRQHPDYAQDAFASGLDFWTFGVRGGFVWYENGQPLCSQWLLGEMDTAILRARSRWGGMYPPLPPGTAQVEKLWTFSTARQRGIASRFAAAMFDEARQRGVRTLITHIHEANEAARSWAQKTGWTAYGTIVRYTFDAPIVREFNLNVCAHRYDGDNSRAG